MSDDKVRVEWIGIKLPSDNEVITYQRLNHELTRKQLAAVKAMDKVLVPWVRIDGTNGIEMGPKNTGTHLRLDHNYRWHRDTGYVQEMTRSDYRKLSRMPEGPQFRCLDSKSERKRQPDYPSVELMSQIRVNRFGELVAVTSVEASVINRMLRKAKRDSRKPIVISERIMRQAKEAGYVK